MQQEMLVILRSSFAGSQLETNEENRNLTPEEKLEAAFSNGSIREFFPEVFKNTEHKMFLWEMHPGFSFLQLEFGEKPLNIDIHYSIDPHNFLATKCYN